MQLEIYQWLAPLLSIFYIIRTIRQYSRGKYSPRNAIIWIVFWIGIAMLALMPDAIANSLAASLGIRDHINAIIFVALGLLFLMVFYLSAALNRVENQLTDLVRKLALSEAQQGTPPINKSLENPPPAIESATTLEIPVVEEEIELVEELERVIDDLENRIPDSDENLDEIPNAGKTYHKGN